MNRNYFWWAIVFVVILTFAVILFFGTTDRVVSMDVFSAMVLLMSVVAAVIGYTWARAKDFLNVSVVRRQEFITNSDLQDIRTKIEHNDIELQTLVAILNTSDNPYDSKVLTRQYWVLHEKFDDYLNYLEGVCLLFRQRCITKEDLEGLWSYYFGRLRKAHTLDSNQLPKIKEMDDYAKSLHESTTGNDGDKFSSKKTYKEIPDPLICEISSNNKYKKILNELKEQDRKKQINPIERPIWYYINYGDYKFTAIIEMVKKLYLELENQTEQKNISLLKDGI